MGNQDWIDAYQAERDRLDRLALLDEYRQTIAAVERQIILADDELYLIHLWCEWVKDMNKADSKRLPNLPIAN